LREKILKPLLVAFILSLLLVLSFQGHHRVALPDGVNPQQLVGLPLHIQIPAIQVDAKVEHVGIVSNGSMDVPQLPMDAAWYSLGSRPGELGSAVIDGHVNWINNAPGVFKDLNKLKPGDKVMVEDDQGVTVSFVVRESRNYSPDADASDVFRSDDGLSHLNLITCSGIWNQATENYSQRLVIFTDREIQ
jgi:sortase A